MTTAPLAHSLAVTRAALGADVVQDSGSRPFAVDIPS